MMKLTHPRLFTLSVCALITASCGKNDINVPAGSLLAEPGETIEDHFVASNGIRASYRLYRPRSQVDTHPGFLIYLHIDTAAEYRGIFDDLRQVAEDHHLTVATMLAPNAFRAWWRGGDSYVPLVDEFIQHQVLGQLPIDTGRLYFSGGSGGAWFLTGIFLPLVGDRYATSGAVLLCGAQPNWRHPTFPTSDAFRTQFKLRYHTKQGDRVFPEVEESIRYYQEAGMEQMSQDLPVGNGHCRFDGGIGGSP